MRRSVNAILGLGLLTAITATPALAQSETIRVPYAQSDLATPQAVDQLYQRVVDAAKSVCNDLQMQSPITSYDRRACRAAAIEAAIETANLAPLSARHEGVHDFAPAAPAPQN